jgi:hypothetical protein
MITPGVPDVGPVNCCTAPSGGFDHSGSATLNLRAGDVYGVRMSGSNLDQDRRLNGTLTLNFPDRTRPTVTPVITGSHRSSEWYTTDVGVHWNVEDPDSDITSRSGCDDTTVKTDTAGIAFECTAVSAGGSTRQRVTIKRDATPPVYDGPAEVNGKWTPNGMGSAVITYPRPTASDALSGLEEDTCPIMGANFWAPSWKVTCGGRDVAGNRVTFTFTVLV